jgi:protein TonB
MSSPKPPAPPPAPLITPARVRNWLGIAFLISIVLHAFALPILSKYRSMEPQDQQVEKVSVTKKIKVVVPTPPPPTPTPPPPTPPPKETPPPKTSTTPPKQPKLKLNVPKTTSKSSSSSTNTERQYVNQPGPSREGIPEGTETAGPITPTAGPATAAPACANPHVDAVATNKVEPDYPEMARQQGAVGTTTVRVTLSTSGAVTNAVVHKSSGNAQLDAAAVRAARSSSYRSEIDNCQPVGGDYLFVATFEAQ